MKDLQPHIFHFNNKNNEVRDITILNMEFPFCFEIFVQSASVQVEYATKGLGRYHFH